MSNIDSFLEMWLMQRNQQRDFQLDPTLMNEVSIEVEVKNLILGINEELGEMSKHVGNHKFYAPMRRFEAYNVAEDCVDILKYLIAFAQMFGLEHEDIFRVFREKTKVVSDKARSKTVKFDRHTPVVCVDVDNVIANLSVWDENVKSHSNVPVNRNTVSMLEGMKEEFYHDGGFRELEVVPGAVNGMQELENRGWTLVLISARPYWLYKRVYADTLYWLEKHGIPHHLLLFNKDKAEAIYEDVFPAMPSYMLEDRHKHAVEVAKYGIRVLLLDWPYNKSVENTDMITRVADWKEIIDTIGYPKGK